MPFAFFERNDGSNLLEHIEDINALYSHDLLQKMDNENDFREILDSLSPLIRTILLLHHKNGFSLAEIAEIMGNPTNTIKSKYRRAIMSLREQFSSKHVLSEAKKQLNI